jgi:glycosyltransferase involved in cell wall biosynthesis
MAELSVVIITRDEEKNIARCIKSVASLASEVVVVDSHSRDKTQQICISLGAKVIAHDFEGFGKQKQFADNQAKHEWILSLDADEELSPELRGSIEKVISNPAADAYSMNRLTNFCGKWIKHGGWYPDRKVRLYKKSIAKWNNYPVHELLNVNKNAAIKHLNGDLLHYSITTIEHHINQINRYSEIAAGNLLEKGRKTTCIHLILKPIVRFLKIYFLKAGFLDGYFGFVIARNSAFSVYLRYAKAKAMKKKR